MRSLYRAGHGPDDTNAIQKYDAFPEFRLSGDEEPREHEEAVPEVEKEIDESLKQVEKIIDTARQEAEKIKSQAYDEGYQNGEQTGYDEGFRRAEEEGRERHEKEIRDLQERIGSYIKDVEIEKEKILEQYMDDLKSIALAIGEKIVQVSLKSSGDVVERMILSATGRLKKAAWAKIYIGQSSQKTDVSGDSQFIKELSKLSDNVKIVVMEESEPGTCIVELPDEVIDISVGTQLENIKEILNNARM